MTKLDELKALAKLGRELCRDFGTKVRQPQNNTDWLRIDNADGERAEMWIYGVIGDDWDPDDVTAAAFRRQLSNITAPVIDVRVNSPGGVVFDGIAIHSALQEHPAAVNVTVDGLAASAASFIAMAGDDVAMQKPAKMMIHDAGGLTVGNAADHRQMADLLDTMSDTIAQIYADRTGSPMDQWRDKMRAETWFGSAEAVDTGLADRVVGEESAAPAPAAAASKTSTSVQGRGSQQVRAQARGNLDREARGMDIEEIMAALKAIIDGAEGRAMSDEEVKRYEALEVDLANKRTEAVRARQHAYESPAPSDVQAAVHVAPKKEDNGLENAFNHYLRTGKPNQDISGLQVTNAQSQGTGTEGGFTAPEGFRQRLVERLVQFGGLAAEAEEITTDTGNRLPWPTLDDTANTGSITEENTAPGSGSDLVFGERELNAYKYTAPGTGGNPLRVSVELLQDSAFDIESLVIRKLGERIARGQAEHWTSGSGTGEPEGINQSSGPSTTFAAIAPTKDELIDAVHAVDPAYRMGSIWVFNDAQLAEIRKLADDNGRPLWLPMESSGLISTPGGTLLGHRVVIDQSFPSPTAGGGETWGVFGDVLEGYVIRRVRDIQVVVNPWTRANEGQVEYTLWSRADGAVQNPNSFALLNEDGSA